MNHNQDESLKKKKHAGEFADFVIKEVKYRVKS